MKTIFSCISALGLSLSVLSASPQNSLSSYTINLSDFEHSVFSQNGEDGILEKLFEVLGILNEGTYVELAVDHDSEGNTPYFRENYGWKGVSLDSGFQDPSINVYKEAVTVENVNEILENYDTPYEFDLLSIDLDYNDFHVWKAIDDSYRPKVVIIEYNSSLQPTEDLVVVYNATKGWDGSNYFGGSLLAFTRLANEKGYSLINTDKKGVNAIFVRNDLVPASPSIFQDINNVEALYHAPNYGCGPLGGHAADPEARCYQNSFGDLIPVAPKW